MRGYEVADKKEDGHNDVLCDGDDIRARHFENFDTLFYGSVEVDVVGADTGGYAKFEVLCLYPEKGKYTERGLKRRMTSAIRCAYRHAGPLTFSTMSLVR